MNLKRIILILCVSCIISAGQAQILYNDATIGITEGAVMIVNGTALNVDSLSNVGDLHIKNHLVNNGEIMGGGNYYVSGDWENNMIFLSDTSSVELKGTNQFIKGDSITDFFNLTLSGTGIKTQQIDATLSGTLALNDRELHTDTHTFFVINNATLAVTSTSDSGFVSSNNGGYLSRQMLDASVYLFPLGSSTGTWRYRPLEITPQNANPQEFAARFANTIATNENYSINSLDTTLCSVNPDYYHQIRRSSGIDSVGISIYYDNVADLNGEVIAQWQTTSNWSSTGAASTISNPSPTLSSIAKFYWNDFNEIAFAAGIQGLQNVFSKTDVQCTNDSSGQITVAISGGTSPYTYLWSDGQSSSTAVGLSAGSYTVTVTDSLGCTSFDTIVISAAAPLTIVITGDTAICSGKSTTLSAILSDTTADAYQWNTNDTTSIISVSPTTDSVYIVTITYGPCSVTDSFTVTVTASPIADAGNDTSIWAGDNFILAGSGGISYEWIPPTYLDDPNSQYPLTTPEMDITYSLIVINSSGCLDTAEITILIDYDYSLGVPNVFSPNSDGENDYLYVQGRGDGVDFLQFIIYDRWGEKVFESDCCCQESCGWDGYYRGVQMGTAVYVYILKATVNGQPLNEHGNITLIR